MDSESVVHVDTEVDIAVDFDNEPTPNLKKMKKRNNKDDQRENSKTLSELWPKSNKYYEKINTEKESNSASLSKNILTDFKAKKFSFILSINVFQEFLSDLE